MQGARLSKMQCQHRMIGTQDQLQAWQVGHPPPRLTTNNDDTKQRVSGLIWRCANPRLTKGKGKYRRKERDKMHDNQQLGAQRLLRMTKRDVILKQPMLAYDAMEEWTKQRHATTRWESIMTGSQNNDLPPIWVSTIMINHWPATNLSLDLNFNHSAHHCRGEAKNWVSSISQPLLTPKIKQSWIQVVNSFTTIIRSMHVQQLRRFMQWKITKRLRKFTRTIMPDYAAMYPND